MKKNQIFPITLGGLLAACSVVLLLMTGIFPMASYSLPALAGLFVLILVIEFNYKMALVLFLSVCVLSALLIQNKESVLLYSLFFGYYPIIKYQVDMNIPSMIYRWMIKFGFFYMAMLAFYGLIRYVFLLPDLWVEVENFKYGIVFLWLMANITFVLYDRGISGVIGWYLYHIRPKYSKRNNRMN